MGKRIKKRYLRFFFTCRPIPNWFSFFSTNFALKRLNIYMTVLQIINKFMVNVLSTNSCENEFKFV